MTTGEDIATFWLRRSSCDMTLRAGQKLQWTGRQQWVTLYHYQCLLVNVCSHITLRAGQKPYSGGNKNNTVFTSECVYTNIVVTNSNRVFQSLFVCRKGKEFKKLPWDQTFTFVSNVYMHS